MEQLTPALQPRGATGLGSSRHAGDHDLPADLPALGALALEAARPFADGDARARIQALFLLVLLAERDGHTHVDLAALATDEDAQRWIGQIARLTGATPGLAALLDELARGPTPAPRGGDPRVPAVLAEVVGAPGQRTPLVLDGTRLQVARTHRVEVALARAVRARLGRPVAAADGADATMPGGGAAAALTDEQRAAVEAALARPLSVITGGPGTGKTTVVRTLVAAARARGIPAREIALCAPTGKAAQRLAQALGPSDDDLVPSTVHRLLGFRPGVAGAPDRFAHHEQAPLPARLVVCDEAAMLDLHTLERLLAALAAGTNLVLIGDADQLPPVGLGQAFAELCEQTEVAPRRLSRGFRVADDPAGDSLRECARLVCAGDAARLLPPSAATPLRACATPDAVTGAGAEWLDPAPGGAELCEALWRWADLDGHFARARALSCPAPGCLPPEAAREVRALLARLERFRILTALRGERPARPPAPDAWQLLPRSAAALNALFAVRAADSSAPGPPPGFSPGEPVVVRDNDHARGLFNGDTGVVVRLAEDGALGVAFPVEREAVRVLPLRALAGNLDHAYALTVHRAQGSEFDRIALVLPAHPLPLTSRQLVYTALTRARRGALLLGDRAVLEAALARVDRRRMALAAHLGPAP